MNTDLIEALEQIEKEKGIPRQTLLTAIEESLLSAYKKNRGKMENLKIKINPDTGKLHAFICKVVVEEVTDIHNQILLEDARANGFEGKIGEVFENEVVIEELGRLAAQTAKQVMMQKIRETEKQMIYEEFKKKEGKVAVGILQRIEGRNIYLDLGKTEVLLPYAEQIPTEKYRYHDRLKVYILEVRMTNRGPLIIVSRTHPTLIRRLFEMEVPEIQEGVVEIKSVAREPGYRSKIAVHSLDENVEPVGACVGAKGNRVNAVIDELRGEKIDVIRFSENPVEFITASLAPAKITEVILQDENHTAIVTVPDDQLSLSIGKGGQNVRLASRLTGWRIDIFSEKEYAEMKQKMLEKTEVEERLLPEEVKKEGAVEDNT